MYLPALALLALLAPSTLQHVASLTREEASDPTFVCQLQLQQREALMAFFAATGGEQWMNSSGWQGGTPPNCSLGSQWSSSQWPDHCTWFGVTCDNSTDLKSQCMEVNFTAVTSSSTSLAALAWVEDIFPCPAGSVTALRLAGNNLVGDSAVLTLLSSSFVDTMRTLMLDSNSLVGTVPPSLTGFYLLQVFTVSMNSECVGLLCSYEYEW